MTSSPSPDRTFELHVRSLSPSGTRAQQGTVIERLERLDNEDMIDEFTVHVWGKQLDLSTAAARTDAGQFVSNRVAAFEDWARQNDLRINHFFERREIQSGILAEVHTVLTLPVMALAEVRDGEVQCMAPCVDGEIVYSVIDWLDALEDGRGWLSTVGRDGDRERGGQDQPMSNGSSLAEVFR